MQLEFLVKPASAAPQLRLQVSLKHAMGLAASQLRLQMLLT